MRFASAFLAGAFAAQSCFAQDSAVENVIASQIDAFARDDFATAFTFAASSIRDRFGTAERFGAMVREGYPMVHRSADVTFLDLRTAGDTSRQRVLIRDDAGVFHTLEYAMVHGLDGWKIAGVRLLPAAEVGA